MSGTLYLGDPLHSSWSLRAHLLFEKFNVPVERVFVDFSQDKTVGEQLPVAGGETVPLWVDQDGSIASDSLAIAEELASRHPDAGVWPADPMLRSRARSLACEMHSSYSALRAECPMDLARAYGPVPHSEAVLSDATRIISLWEASLKQSGGPWLCGSYSAADAFFAPVAARFVGFSVPMPETAETYVRQALSDPAILAWRDLGFELGAPLPRYAQDYPAIDWPWPQT